MDIDDSTDANEPNPDDFVIRAHSVSPSFIIQLDTEVRIFGHFDVDLIVSSRGEYIR